MVRIFLSYTREDRKKVVELYNRLKQKGYQPWIDINNLLPGQLWQTEIPKAIQNSDIFIACLSKNSVNKQSYVQKEFKMALNQVAERPSGKIFLIPVRLDDCNIPELRQEEYGIQLSDFQWVDLFKPNGFERLYRSIELYFPEASNKASEIVRKNERAEGTRRLSSVNRLELIQTLNALPGPQFDTLLFLLKPPSGNIPSNAAPQASRSVALLEWIESPIGPGIPQLKAILEAIIPHQAEGDTQSSGQSQTVETLRDIIKALAANQVPKYDLRGAKFAGGFAEKVTGDQISNYQDPD